MSFEKPGATALNLRPCRYGTSKLLFRGPPRQMNRPYVAFLGGTETFGRFVRAPFPDVVQSRLQVTCVNLGCTNAGLDSFVRDPDIQRIASAARVRVLQIMGAQNLSNRFYRVHPRRNDRFVEAAPLLCETYPEVDFTEFHFTRHLLGKLRLLSPERFLSVEEELQRVWSKRMDALLRSMGEGTILLWLRYPDRDHALNDAHLGADPLMVTKKMVDALRDRVEDVVEVPIETAGNCQDMDGMVFGPLERPSAGHLPGPGTHMAIADRVAESVLRALK